MLASPSDVPIKALFNFMNTGEIAPGGPMLAPYLGRNAPIVKEPSYDFDL